MTRLAEGEQFANAFFDRETKIKIATSLAEFGVEYIELTNPCASQQSFDDARAICELKKAKGWKTKILTHTRCHMDDARRAIETGKLALSGPYCLTRVATHSLCLGVDGVDVVIGTSSFLREHSHGKDIQWILKVCFQSFQFPRSFAHQTT